MFWKFPGENPFRSAISEDLNVKSSNEILELPKKSLTNSNFAARYGPLLVSKNDGQCPAILSLIARGLIKKRSGKLFKFDKREGLLLGYSLIRVN